MAGDWLKMRTNLWDDPRVGRISDLTESSEAMVIGALYWLWTSADEHTEDGFMPGLSLRQIDRKTGLLGFGAALCDVGWLVDGTDGVTIARFEEHNGASAKRRCAEAQRKANGRNVSASDADKERTDDGQDAPKTGHGAELEKEKEKNSSSLRSEEKPRKARPAVVAPSVLLDAGFSALEAAEFIDHKDRMKSPLTERAWKDHCREAAAVKWTPLEAAEKVMAKNWKGFEAKYVANERPPSRGSPPATAPDWVRERDERNAVLTGGRLGASQPRERQAEVFDVIATRVD